MRASHTFAALALCAAALPASTAAADETALGSAPTTATVVGHARTISFSGGLGGGGTRPLEGLTVSVRDAGVAATTAADGGVRLENAPLGGQHVVVEGPGFEPESEYLDLTPGSLHTLTLVRVGACPEGEACLLAADAVVEIAVEPFERQAERVVALWLHDGSTVQYPVPASASWPQTFVIGSGDAALTVEIYEEQNVFSAMRYARVTDAAGHVLVDTLATHLKDGVMPGCSEACVRDHATIREIRFAASTVGNPAALCEPQICP